MKSNDVFRDARVEHVRELKTQLAACKAELVAAQSELATWQAHSALVVAAVVDAVNLPPNEVITIIDGCNVLLSGALRREVLPDAEFRLRRAELVRLVRERAKSGGFWWIVFDGDVENAKCEGNVRVSYSGGEGAHRADRLIIDYVRAMKLGGYKRNIRVISADKGLQKQIVNAGAECLVEL